jgi:SMC interacting uncharacterized protein involved in chromosome segregation
MSGLRGQTREHIASLKSAESAPEKILRFRAPTRGICAEQEDRPAALQLVYQLADVIRTKEDHAAGIEAQAQELVQRAIDELNFSRARLRSAETARIAAEAGIKEANTKIEEFEGMLKYLETRIAAAETQLSSAILRANAAETRAADSQNALKQLEEAIRAQNLKANGRASDHSDAAA